MICGRALAVEVGVDSEVGLIVRGVLKAPVEAFCKRSNSSCSFGGSRGGAGPVEKAGRWRDWEKKRRDGRNVFLGRSRDILIPVSCCSKSFAKIN